MGGHESDNIHKPTKAWTSLLLLPFALSLSLSACAEAAWFADHFCLNSHIKRSRGNVSDKSKWTYRVKSRKLLTFVVTGTQRLDRCLEVLRRSLASSTEAGHGQARNSCSASYRFACFEVACSLVSLCVSHDR